MFGNPLTGFFFFDTVLVVLKLVVSSCPFLLVCAIPRDSGLLGAIWTSMVSAPGTANPKVGSKSLGPGSLPISGWPYAASDWYS
jgi:hypothetical protein